MSSKIEDLLFIINQQKVKSFTCRISGHGGCGELRGWTCCKEMDEEE